MIPIAILTTESFDATRVNGESVAFGPDGARITHGGHFEDVDGDGDIDWLGHFRTRETGIECGLPEAKLTAETTEGDPLEGVDTILTVDCR